MCSKHWFDNFQHDFRISESLESLGFVVVLVLIDFCFVVVVCFGVFCSLFFLCVCGFWWWWWWFLFGFVFCLVWGFFPLKSHYLYCGEMC